jgi:hypothetical protein
LRADHQTLTFEYGIACNKCSEGNGFNHFDVKFPCNPLIEDYTEVLYTIEEEDIASIQYKMSLRGSMPMRNVDVLRLIFMDIYVPALTSRFSSIETSLQLSENINLFAVFCINTDVINKDILIGTCCLGRISCIWYNVGKIT